MRHPDEGTIHAWLDGALPAEEAHALEEHAASCAECAARVAEARGMVAGASRILAALDSAPGGVVPAAARGARPPSRRAAWWHRPGIGVAAAMAIVAVGTTWAVTRNWATHQAVQSEAAAPVELRADDSMLRVVVPESVSAASNTAAADQVSLPMPAQARPIEDGRASGIVGGAASRSERTATPQSTVPAAETRQSVERRIELLEERRAAAGGVAKAEPAARERTTSLRQAGADSARFLPAAPPAPAAREPLRAMADAQIVSGRILAATARDLAGCYALELGQSTTADAPRLPSMVQLAESRDEAANAVTPPPAAQGFSPGARLLLVPPAADSAQLGWRITPHDSVSVRMEADGRVVRLTFPAAASTLRFGVAETGELPGVSGWRAAVTVRRVPCPVR